MTEHVEIIIKNGRSYFNGKYPRDIVDNLLAAPVAGARFSPAFQSKRWDGYVRFLSRASNSFPLGLTTLVREELEANDYSLSVTNTEIPVLKEVLDPGVAERLEGGFEMLTSAGSVVFRDYQCEAGNAYLSGEGDTPYRGILHMGTGCHAMGQGIMLSNGKVRNVEDIRPGDLLMGMDSAPRLVQRCIRGRGKMYKIVPIKGKPFEVNEDHILTLKKTSQEPMSTAPCRHGGSIVDVSVKEYLSWSKKKKHLYKLFRVPISSPRYARPLSPYILGILLGDGHLSNKDVNLTSADPEVYSHFTSYLTAMGHSFRVQSQEGNASFIFHVKGTATLGQRYSIRSILSDLHLLGTRSGDKFIPSSYKTLCTSDRLELLAGLIDTDGSLSGNGYDYISKSEVLANDVAFISRSVGLAAYVTTCEKRCQTGGGGTYYRVSISGDCDIVPCKILRKRAKPRLQKKNVLVTGFVVESLDEGDYYGFTLDGDGRYLLDDFTVTHNSGKTLTAAGIIYALNMYGEVPTLFLVHGKSLVQQTYDAFLQVFEPELLGMCRGDVWKPGLITIASVDTIHSRLKVDDDACLALLNTTVFIVADECHRASSKAWVKILEEANAPFRLGLSGTPMKRQDDRDLRLLAMTGPVVYHLATTTLQAGGHVSEAELTVVVITTPKMLALPWQDAFRSLIVAHHERTELISKMAISRARAGKTVLILAGNSVQFAHNIHDIITGSFPSCQVITGITESAVTNQAFQDLRDKKLDILITTLLADEGVDVPAVNVLMLVGGGMSYVKAIQRVGRGLRIKKDGTSLEVIEFVDLTNRFLAKHAKARLQYYTEENIFKSGKTVVDEDYVFGD